MSYQLYKLKWYHGLIVGTRDYFFLHDARGRWWEWGEWFEGEGTCLDLVRGWRFWGCMNKNTREEMIPISDLQFLVEVGREVKGNPYWGCDEGPSVS